MSTPTVLHGVDQSCESYAKLPARANVASQCFIEDLKAMRINDPADNVWKPFDYIPFVYDFAVHGGVVGDIGLGVYVPKDTVILDGLLDVVDAVTGGTSATIALKVEGAADVLAAAVLGTNGTEGLHDVVPDGSAAKAIKTTAARQVTLTVGVAALTAGKLYGFLRCFRGFAS